VSPGADLNQLLRWLLQLLNSERPLLEDSPAEPIAQGTPAGSVVKDALLLGHLLRRLPLL
jgi:hypothetical protein